MKNLSWGLAFIIIILLLGAIGDILFVYEAVFNPDTIIKGRPVDINYWTNYVLVLNTIIFSSAILGTIGIIYEKSWGYLCAKICVSLNFIDFMRSFLRGGMDFHKIKNIIACGVVMLPFAIFYFYIHKMQKRLK